MKIQQATQSEFMKAINQKEESLSKYFNKKVEIDGIEFDSKKEGNRYLELKLLEKAKKVRNIRVHVPFPILEAFSDFEGTFHRGINYEVDFEYEESIIFKGRNKWAMVAEDVKGFKTGVYKLKKKLFLAKYKEYIFRET